VLACRGVIGVSWALSFLASFILSLHLRYLNMSRANLFAGAHHFVASNSTFIEAKTVSGMFTEGIRQADGVGPVADQFPQQLW
jgi:hypothetical protein